MVRTVLRKIYLLCPPGVERHSARPVSLLRYNPALKKKVDGVFTGLFTHVVVKLGLTVGLTFMNGALGAPRPAAQRYTYTAAAAVHGQTVDEVMQALTALTGDPWDRLKEAYVLSLSGKSLTYEQRARMAPNLARVHLLQSFTRQQSDLMTTEAGLSFGQLSLPQQQALVLFSVSMRESTRAAPDQLILKRERINDTTWGKNIQVYARIEGRLQPVGQTGEF